MSSSSSSSLAVKQKLHSVSEILDLSGLQTVEWCSKLGLASGGSKRDRRVALIEHITSKKPRSDEPSFLAFNKEKTSCVWTFSKDDLLRCDAAERKKEISKTFFDKNGCQWKIKFYAKGDTHSAPQKAAVFLKALNLKVVGAVSVRVNYTFLHVESGTSFQRVRTFYNSESFGQFSFMSVPSAAASECPICLGQVLEKLATECGHAFCAKCTVRMLTDAAEIKCPLCRRNVARSDELVSVRYSALDSFTLKVTLRTLQLDKDMGADVTLGDVVQMTNSFEQSLESKLSALSKTMERKFERRFAGISRQIDDLHNSINAPVSGFKRRFSQMNGPTAL